MTGARIAAPLTVAVALAIGALTLAPRAFEADSCCPPGTIRWRLPIMRSLMR